MAFMNGRKTPMKFAINRTDAISWSISAALILLLNTNLKTGEVNWTWTLLIFASALAISRIQEYLMPLLMRRAANWPVQRMLGAYVLVCVLVAIIISTLVLIIIQLVKKEAFPARVYVSSGLTYVLMTIAFTSVYVIQQLTDRWKKSLLQQEQLNQALLRAEYDALKNQVNPHFLFNSLNILSALIPEDPENAVNLVERLSKVFRYNLQNNDRVTVELGTELKIVEAYLFIHKMRFGENLQYDLSVDKADGTRSIVTQGLLTLVENALKHNECSSEKPLTISLFVDGDRVVVRNTFQPKNKQFLESTGIGLSNLKSRYKLVTSAPVEVKETVDFFEVSIPFCSASGFGASGY